MINSNLTIMKHKKLYLIVLIAILSIVLRAQDSSGKAEPKIQADHQEITDDKLIAYGNVEIAWEEYRIYADRLEFHQKTKDIVAVGRVTMCSNETVITGEKLTFNLKERTGEMYDTYGQSPPTIRYTTDILKQTDNDTMTFKKLDLTSCSQCVPRWVITCRKGKIKKEKYIEMKDVVLKIKKIPVFYLPYLRYPIKKDGRATGFLFPSIGNSNIRGFFILNSFFWAIKPNVDFTLNFDYYAKGGIGVAEEFRYLFRGMEGDVKFYYFKYKEDNILNAKSTSDYFLKMTHKQKIRFFNTNITVNIDKQSDANFLRLFSNDFESVLARTSRSAVAITSSPLTNLRFTVSASQNETYYTFNNTKRSVSYLPDIRLNLSQQKIWKLPGYLSFEVSYGTVNRKGTSYEEEEAILTTDVSSTRINLDPSYTLSLLNEPWLGAALKVQSKHTFYMQSLDPDTELTVDEPLHLHYNTLNFYVRGPVFFKIFEFKNFNLKNIIEPKITFSYVSRVDEEDRARLIPVDYFDYPSFSYVGFSLTTRLLYRNKNKQESAREIFSHIIEQDYYFDPDLANRSRMIDGIYPEFSQLENTLRFRPIEDISLDGKLTYNYYLQKFTRVRLSMNYTKKSSILRGSFFYNTYINQYAKADYPLNRESVGGDLNFDAPRFPFKFKAVVNYDITDGEFRTGLFRLGYDYQCIRFNAELRLFRYSGRVETQFNFGVTFGNLGMVKDLLGIE